MMNVLNISLILMFQNMVQNIDFMHHLEVVKIIDVKYFIQVKLLI